MYQWINGAIPSRKCSIKAPAKWKNSVYVLTEICHNRSKWFGPWCLEFVLCREDNSKFLPDSVFWDKFHKIYARMGLTPGGPNKGLDILHMSIPLEKQHNPCSANFGPWLFLKKKNFSDFLISRKNLKYNAQNLYLMIFCPGAVKNFNFTENFGPCLFWKKKL